MSKYINTHSLDIECIKSQVENKGYSIVQNVVDTAYLDLQRTRWEAKVNSKKDLNKFVRGNLIFGEKNFLSFSHIPKWHLYRYYEFLWNKTDDPDSLEVHMQLNKVRNLIKGDDSRKGITLNDDCYGVYISTSLYHNEGFLHAHADGHGKDPILHYMLPLTFKGSGFMDGGLVVWDKEDNKIMVEEIISEGSVIFFDGRQKHEVEKISTNDNQLGRLASFAIPCYFEKDAQMALFKRGLKIRLDEIKNRINSVFN